MGRLEARTPHPYAILIGQGLLDTTVSLASPGPKVLLYDRKLQAYAARLSKRLSFELELPIQGGEEAKRITVYSRLLQALARVGLPRETTLYVLGGGTLTDLGGFVAASYLRGIAYISLPTTTLAMVDASVGGKTGVNLPQGKNLVGAFHAPGAVFADTETLATLPQPLFRAGLVEAFKQGLIGADEELLSPFALHPAHPALSTYLERAVGVKLGIVEADYREQGVRRHLNLGHTLGHAIEAASKHQITHGEAVAYGMVYAVFLGRALGGEDLRPLMNNLLNWLQPTPLPGFGFQGLLRYVDRDKKKHGGRVHWVVPLAPGRIITQPLDTKALREAYYEMRGWLDDSGAQRA